MTITLTWQNIIAAGYLLNVIIFVFFIWIPEGGAAVKKLYTNNEEFTTRNSRNETIILWVFTLLPYGLIFVYFLGVGYMAVFALKRRKNGKN